MVTKPVLLYFQIQVLGWIQGIMDVGSVGKFLVGPQKWENMRENILERNLMHATFVAKNLA